MNTAELRQLPCSALAHLGCAGLILLLGISGSLASHTQSIHAWLLFHPYTMPLACLAALVAAYLLEYSISTATMLSLLLASAICAGGAFCGLNPEPDSTLLWILLTGPLGYFLMATLVLHLRQEPLLRWQHCCICIAGAALLPVPIGILLGESFPTMMLGTNLGILTAAYELYVFFSRSYFEITSESRMRSTVIAMVMLTTVPVCKTIWYSLYYGRGFISALFRIFLRW
jgi:hypothetical protein